MKLSAKLILLFVLSGLLMLLSVFLLSSRGNDHLEQGVIQSFEREASMLMLNIDKQLAERYNDTRLFSQLLGEVGEKQLAFITSGADFTNKLNQFVLTYQDYRRVMVFDINGRALAMNTKNRFGKTIQVLNSDPEKVRLSYWFQAVKSGRTLSPDHSDGVYVSGPVRGMITGDPQAYDMLLARAILNPAGEVVGVWVNLLDFRVVEEMVWNTYQFKADRRLHHAEIFLLDSEGGVIVDMRPLEQGNASYQRNFSVLHQLNLAKAGAKDARMAVSGQDGVDIFADRHSQQQLISGYAHSPGFRDFPGLGWSVLLRVPAEDVLLSTEFFLYVLLFSVLLLIVWGAVLYSVIRMLMPLSYIRAAMTQLAQGNTEGKPLALTRRDELGQIAGLTGQLQQEFAEQKERLTASESQLAHMDIPHRAIHAMTTGMCVIDMTAEELPIIYVNPEFEFLTGYSSAEILGKNLNFLQAPGEQPVCEQVQADFEARRFCAITVNSARRNGVVFRHHLRLDPVFGESGELLYYLVLNRDITAHLQHQDQLRTELEEEIASRSRASTEAENRLRAVFNTALDGIVVLDNEGFILDVNYSFETIFGRSKKILLGQNITTLMVPEVGEAQEGLTVTSLISGYHNRRGGAGKLVGLHMSGQTFPVEISVGETWLDNRPAYVGVVRDITEQVDNWRREQALKIELTEREIIYRAAFSNAAIGIARLSVEGQFLEVNRRLCKDVGYSEDVLLALSFPDISYIEDTARVRQLVESVKQGQQEEFTTDTRYVTKSGEVRWATISVSLVRNPDGSPKYFIAVIEDISERKAFEKALRDAKTQREELLQGRTLASEAGGICHWSINLHTGILKWDDNMYRLYGVIKDDRQLTYEDWRARIHPEDVAMTESLFRDCVDNLIPFNCEFRVIHQQTGQVYWVKGAADVVTGQDDSTEMMHGINLDITEERQAQLRLEKETLAARQASEAKSRFLATMSHEIRTPMNGVIGMIDLLRDTALSQDQKRMVSTVRDSAFSLLEIINDILDFSKIEAGQMALEYTETSLLPLIEKTTEALWVNAGDKGVDLFIHFDFNTPALMLLDSVRIRQILLNLLGNSIKFTNSEERQGYVIIHTRYHAGMLSLSVEDNGLGMTQAQTEKLFRPFSQADSSTTRKYGGTGLGLSITKSFVDLMGGTIDVESEAGQGSTFTVNLPVESPDEATLSLPGYDFSGHKLRVDIADRHLRRACLHVIEQLDFADVMLDERADTESQPDSVVSETDLSAPDLSVLRLTDAEVSDSGQQPVLSLTRDPIRSLGYVSQHNYVVGAHPLKPDALVAGLAISCGLESPDVDWDFTAFHEEQDGHMNEHEPTDENCPLILCAEDQPVNQLVISRQLEKLGYAYEMAENGREALELWRSGRFALVLTDCHMPEMDGYELTSEIRQIEEHEGRERTVIIALTANAMAGESEHCLKAGMDDYISKPVELKTLKKILSLRLKSLTLKASSADSSTDESGNSQISGIDYQQLSSVIGTDDQSLMRAVLAMFWESVSKDLSALENAVKEENSELIRSKAHGAKGASASSGAVALSHKFKQVETQCADLNAVTSLVEDIKSEMEHLEHSLKEDGII